MAVSTIPMNRPYIELNSTLEDYEQSLQDYYATMSDQSFQIIFHKHSQQTVVFVMKASAQYGVMMELYYSNNGTHHALRINRLSGGSWTGWYYATLTAESTS